MDKDSARYCFVVADEARAIIYGATSRRGDLQELRSMENETVRKKIDQLISDKGGRSFDSHGQGRHTLIKETSNPKRHASAMFAKNIVQWLSAAKHKGACCGFAVVAAPRFLGLLREELASSSVGEPFLAINKDVVGIPAAEIRELIDRAL